VVVAGAVATWAAVGKSRNSVEKTCMAISLEMRTNCSLVPSFTAAVMVAAAVAVVEEDSDVVVAAVGVVEAVVTAAHTSKLPFLYKSSSPVTKPLFLL